MSRGILMGMTLKVVCGSRFAGKVAGRKGVENSGLLGEVEFGAVPLLSG